MIPCTAGIDERYRQQKEVLIYFGFTDAVAGQAFMRSLWRQEGGLDAKEALGHEAGWDNKRRFLGVHVNPCLSPDSRSYGQSSLAVLTYSLDWIMRDPDRRADFMRDFSKWYHSGGAADDRQYARDLGKIFLDERAKVKAGYYCVPPSASPWG